MKKIVHLLIWLLVLFDLFFFLPHYLLNEILNYLDMIMLIFLYFLLLNFLYLLFHDMDFLEMGFFLSLNYSLNQCLHILEYILFYAFSFGVLDFHLSEFYLFLFFLHFLSDFQLFQFLFFLKKHNKLSKENHIKV